MTEAAGGEDALARARLRGKRIALVTVIGVAVVFVAASSLQIVPAVFGAGITPIPSGPPGSSARACAEGVRALMQALDSPQAAAERPRDEEWDRAVLPCEQTPGGLDAWAALMRLRSAREEDGCRRRVDLDPLRQQVAEHLPADLR